MCAPLVSPPLCLFSLFRRHFVLAVPGKNSRECSSSVTAHNVVLFRLFRRWRLHLKSGVSRLGDSWSPFSPLTSLCLPGPGRVSASDRAKGLCVISTLPLPEGSLHLLYLLQGANRVVFLLSYALTVILYILYLFF